jgi:hypothetical protein
MKTNQCLRIISLTRSPPEQTGDGLFHSAVQHLQLQPGQTRAQGDGANPERR